MFSFISAFVGLALAALPTAASQVNTVASQINPSTSTSRVVTASDTTPNAQNGGGSDVIIASITFSSNGGTGYYGDMIIGAGGATCLSYISDAADDLLLLDLGGPRFISTNQHISL